MCENELSHISLLLYIYCILKLPSLAVVMVSLHMFKFLKTRQILTYFVPSKKTSPKVIDKLTLHLNYFLYSTQPTQFSNACVSER